jgi:hypothetical protein
LKKQDDKRRFAMEAPRNWFVTFITGAIFVGIFLAAAFFICVLYAATTAVPTCPLVTISETLPADGLVAGQPVIVFAHSSDPDGIADVLLWINGQPAAT